MFFVLGYTFFLIIKTAHGFCELQPSTLSARSSYFFVAILKRKILIQFNDILFQLGLKRLHIREIFCFKSVDSPRVFVRAKEGTVNMCVPENATVVSKPFIT
jgi:hypothetical protein